MSIEFGFGTNSECLKLFDKKSNTYEISKIKGIEGTVKQVAITTTVAAVLTHQGEVYNLKAPKPVKFDCPPMTMMSGAWKTIILLSSDNNIYTYGDNSYGQLGQGTKKVYGCPQIVPYFTKIECKAVYSAYFNCFVTDIEGNLYGMGLNNSYDLIYDQTSDQSLPVVCDIKNVERIYTGSGARHAVAKLKDGKYYFFGQSSSSQFGVKRSNSKTPFFSPFLNDHADEIKDITMSYDHTSVLFKNGCVYSAGTPRDSGATGTDNGFKKLSFFNSETNRAHAIYAGYHYTVVLTDEGNLYQFGSQVTSSFEVEPKMKNEMGDYKKITNIGELPLPSRIYCGYNFSLFFINEVSEISESFLELYKSGKFTNTKLMERFNVHKHFVEKRLGCTIEEINQKLASVEYDKIEILIDWVYSDNTALSFKLKDILPIFNIQFPIKNTLQNDLVKLFKDEDSKDFSILVKDDVGSEEDDEEDESYEEIPVHKSILVARSGLFREMFENISSSDNKVKDYSGKTIDSLEVFIEFLYKNTIELSADHDPQLVVEELEDAAEFYQLNDHIHFQSQLNKIKKTFNL
ncbi:hypothetical protein M0813_12947 [Anaeramoeba flamelloides]|uniref:BTB domain-containing protein n=1 Tax=Anaeramoeba flamelloides TaxID=1746091 RepID=A0ABQ8Z9I6_9EUKA|nr:hypothetical protein M0813_12947 [Anaeramoeba flamelloides]